MKARRVLFVLFPGVQSLDVSGPFEVFAGGNAWARHAGRTTAYELGLCARRAGPVATQSGFELVAQAAFAADERAIDTLVVPGGRGVDQALHDRVLLRAIARMAARARRVVSVCSGALLLAEIGLLDGKRAATHWARCDELAQRYPRVRVEREPIFVRDGRVYTSAGVTAGIDLALALVEDDLGREAALAIARGLVLFLRRSGHQAQFSAQLALQSADREPLRDVQRLIAEQPGLDLSIETLARRAGMSVRNFARCFRAETGLTPARYVEQVRLEAARRRLTESKDGVELIAATCGFGSAESLRRAFARKLALTPSEYRERFRSMH
jgi:transcriptional regulator GlxA family with amidase domain